MAENRGQQGASRDGKEPEKIPYNPLSNVRIVLVEPAGPRNIGSVARVMANFGLEALVLVAPQCDHLGQEAQTMAVHAKEILQRATVVKSLPEALVSCQRVAATLGRDFAGRVPVEAIAQVSPWLLAQDLPTSKQSPSAIIFGREDHGLSNDDLDYAQRLVTIPTGADYVSLNLAQAVGVCAYELMQTAGGYGRQLPGKEGAIASEGQHGAQVSDEAPPTFEQLEGFYRDLEELLLEVGYLYPHTANKRMKTFRNLLHRSHPTIREVAMLRGILRQVRWAINQPQSPTD
ncbi:MAG: RNA methyltransferase [Cyanobacteria bacterium P01_F01_bin.153]